MDKNEIKSEIERLSLRYSERMDRSQFDLAQATLEQIDRLESLLDSE